MGGDRAVSWSDSGARTGPHELGLIANIAARNDDDEARRLYRKYRMELFRFGCHVLHDQGLEVAAQVTVGGSAGAPHRLLWAGAPAAPGSAASVPPAIADSLLGLVVAGPGVSGFRSPLGCGA